MSVTKNLNQNQLQQVEMRLRHVYFHRTLQHHMIICTCVLCHFKRYLKNTLALHTRPLHTLLELLLTSKGHMTWIISKVNNIPMHCGLAYESVRSLATCSRLWRRMLRRYQKRSKKHISTSNFETSSYQNVTAKKPLVTCISCMLTWPDIRAYRDHSTIWCIRLFDPCIKYAHCLCAEGLIRLAWKECFFCLSFLECYPYNRNLWFLLKIFTGYQLRLGLILR